MPKSSSKTSLEKQKVAADLPQEKTLFGSLMITDVDSWSSKSCGGRFLFQLDDSCPEEDPNIDGIEIGICVIQRKDIARQIKHD